MSKPRELIDFTGSLPADKLTKVLGVTLFCLQNSTSFDEFKKCTVPQSSDDEMIEGSVEPEGSFMETVTDSINNAAADASDTLATITLKNKKYRKK